MTLAVGSAPVEWRASADEQLMNRVAGGDARAFGELYDRYSDRALRLARSVCHSPDRAEDAVQEAFISVWNSRSTYREQRGSVAAWLLTVVRYRAIDISRRNGLHAVRRSSDDAVATLRAPGDLAQDAEERAHGRRLRALLADLPDAQREVIVLAFYAQLSHTEIADRLGLPTGTVKGRMRLGLKKLRSELDALSA